MPAHPDKTQKDKSQSVTNTRSQKQGSGESSFQFVDNRLETIAQRKLQEVVNNSPQAKQTAQLQAMADTHTSKQHPVQKKENKTGLPDSLKSGIENLSGYSMNDVKVHYNSDKPAQLQAHAYAQGTNIHLASGQEKHLPHEAWHVVQQKQGRVKPTKQLKSSVAVNDDAGLEKEADVMGSKALQLKGMGHTLRANLPDLQNSSAQLVVQRVKFLTSTVPHLDFSEATQTHFDATMVPYSGGFDGHDALKPLGLFYLYKYSQYENPETHAPSYKGTSFNATLPINAQGGEAHFNFEFNDDNTKATVRLVGLAKVGAHIVEHAEGKPGAILKLKADFGIKDVVDGSAAWTVGELAKMDAAFSLMSATNQAVLKDVALKRVNEIASDDAHSHTLAVYHSAIDPGGVDIVSKTIEVSDKTFTGDSKHGGKAASFVKAKDDNLVPMSFHTILHEVGHAVEKHTYLAKSLEYHTALKETNAANTTRSALIPAHTAAVIKVNEEGPKWNTFVAEHTAHINSEKGTLNGLRNGLGIESVAALSSTGLALVNQDDNSPAKVQALEEVLAHSHSAEVIAAGRKIIELKEKKWRHEPVENYAALNTQYWKAYEACINTLINKSNDYIKQINALTAKINNLIGFSNALIQSAKAPPYTLPAIPAEIVDLNVGVRAEALLTANKEFHVIDAQVKAATLALDGKKGVSDAKKTERDKTHSEANGTTRIQNFITYVEKHGLAPTAANPLTSYALKSWQENKKEEYYAEAFSMFHTNPSFMRTEKYIKLYNYFHLEVHNKDNRVDVTFGEGNAVNIANVE